MFSSHPAYCTISVFAETTGSQSVITLLSSVCCHLFTFYLIMVYLTTLSIYQAVKHQMHGCLVNSECQKIWKIQLWTHLRCFLTWT